MEVQPKFFDTNQPSTSREVKTMPKRFEQLIRKAPMKKVSKLKYFFKSCLALISDKYVLAELTTLIAENPHDLRIEKRVNHTKKKLKTDREL